MILSFVGSVEPETPVVKSKISWSLTASANTNVEGACITPLLATEAVLNKSWEPPPPPVIVTVTLSVVGSVIVAPTKLIDSTSVVTEVPLSKISIA
jgi:hypothetical protein